MGCCRCSPRLPTLLLREAAALLGRWGAGRPTWPEGRVPDARCVSGSYASHQLPGSWAPSSPVGVTVEVLYMPLGSFSGTGSTGSWAPTILVRGGGRAGFAQVSGQVPARYTCVHAPCCWCRSLRRGEAGAVPLGDATVLQGCHSCTPPPSDPHLS